MTTWLPLALVIVGLALVIIGTFMSLADWNKRHRLEARSEDHALGEVFEGLAKLFDALKGYPPGAQMTAFGIVLIVLGGLFGGVVAIK